MRLARASAFRAVARAREWGCMERRDAGINLSEVFLVICVSNPFWGWESQLLSSFPFFLIVWCSSVEAEATGSVFAKYSSFQVLR